MERRKKKAHDFSVTVFRVVQGATGQIEPKRTIDFKALGHLGGLKGGVARAARLTSERAGRDSKEGSTG